jgi:hypothetical protein
MHRKVEAAFRPCAVACLPPNSQTRAEEWDIADAALRAAFFDQLFALISSPELDNEELMFFFLPGSAPE